MTEKVGHVDSDWWSRDKLVPVMELSGDSSAELATTLEVTL